MATLKKIKEDLKLVGTIESIVEVFEEIANIRIQKIKEKVLKSRKMFEELLACYQRVKGSYLAGVESGILKEAKLKEKGGSCVVFLSANELFYGGFIFQLWEKTKMLIKAKKPNCLVTIGSIGKSLISKEKFAFKTYAFEVEELSIREREISQIVEILENYFPIFIVHGKYERGFVQKVKITEISEKRLPPPLEEIKTPEVYIFEPSVEEVLEFFEREIVKVLFLQTILEHYLAKLAARVSAMFQAREKAKALKKKLQIEEIKKKREMLNKKQIELFGSHSLWK
jgi:ATP synthase F1 gamma subunit